MQGFDDGQNDGARWHVSSGRARASVAAGSQGDMHESSLAVAALLGGQIDAVSSGPATVLKQVKAGKLRVLGSAGLTSPL